MFRWAMAFLTIGLVAGLFAFIGGIPVAVAGVAKILFLGFLVLFLVAFVGNLLRPQRPSKS